MAMMDRVIPAISSDIKGCVMQHFQHDGAVLQGSRDTRVREPEKSKSDPNFPSRKSRAIVNLPDGN
jgi:hypothetical protein